MAEVKAALRLQLITGGLAEVQAATRAVQALSRAGAAGAAGEVRAASAAAAATERATTVKLRGLRTVESEMARLTQLEKNRAITAEARKALGGGGGGGGGGGFFTGHGFTDRARSVVGGIRDLTVAGMGMRYAFGAAVHSVHALIDPVREFQYELATLKSKQNFAPDVMQAISDKAKEMGRTTMFTPTQALEAGTQLAAAGVHGHDVAGALPTAMQFAQAANISAEESAHLMVQTATQFGMGANNESFRQIGDIFVKAKTSSTASIQEIGEAMNYVGPIAKQAGLSLQFTASAVSLLAEGGIKGSTAGTGLRRVITSLVKPTKESAKAMGEIGITAKDMSKGLNDLPGFFRKLNAAEEAHHLNRAGRLKLLKAAFSDRGMTIAAELQSAALKTGAGSWKLFEDRMNDADGTMQKVSDTLSDTLEGKIKKMDAALETAKITLGESFVPMLTAAIPKMTEAANAAGNWVQKNQALLPQLVEIGGAVAAGVVGTKLVAGVGSALQLLAPEATLAGASFATAFGAAFVAGIAAYGLTTALLDAMHIDMGKIGEDLYDYLHGTSDHMDTRDRSVSSAISAKKLASANVRPAGYAPMSAQNDLSLDLSGAPAHLPMSGQIDITLTDDRAKIKTRSNSIPLRTGANAGAR